jgi:pheromone shutdown protein TraB
MKEELLAKVVTWVYFPAFESFFPLGIIQSIHDRPLKKNISYWIIINSGFSTVSNLMLHLSEIPDVVVRLTLSYKVKAF